MEKTLVSIGGKSRWGRFCIVMVLVTGVAFSVPALAQGPGSGGPPIFEEEEETPPTEIPIDGGATLLLAAGAGYGLKKLRDRRKRETLEE